MNRCLHCTSRLLVIILVVLSFLLLSARLFFTDLHWTTIHLHVQDFRLLISPLPPPVVEEEKTVKVEQITTKKKDTKAVKCWDNR